MNTIAYAASSAQSLLEPHRIERRLPAPDDIQLDILFCGVCHSDLHMVRNEWNATVYPVVPGHEIVGRITALGSHVQGFSLGDMVGVGCMVDSCQTCGNCHDGLEQYCDTGFVGTYNGKDKHGRGITYGGYSASIVVNQKFVLRIPASLDPAATAPLLCAGITTYSPMRHWNVQPGQKVGIVGLGGLGHVAVKIARAMGAHVVLFTTSPGKKEDALKLGANEVIISSDPEQMQRHKNQLDFILDTVAAPHNLDAFLALLKTDGTMTLVGAPAEPHPSPSAFSLIMQRRQLTGSHIGGIRETQEMLDFCAEHGITSEIELIGIDKINVAYERMLKNDVKYRFVIDMSTLKQQAI